MNFQREQKFLQVLEVVYDALYENKVIKEKNPCQFQISGKGKTLCVSCIYKRSFTKPFWDYIGGFTNNLCCTDCQFLGPKGCQAEKPIMCRSWLCSQGGVELFDTEVKKQLSHLTGLINDWGFYCFRGDKKMCINSALELVKGNWYHYPSCFDGEQMGYKLFNLMKKFKINGSKCELKFGS